MISNFWQNYHFGIDPWAAEYDIPIRMGEEAEATEQSINCDVEGIPWAVCRPLDEPTLPERVTFIDGRRRVDVRLVGNTEGQVVYGAFATVAVGAVQVNLATQQSGFLDPVLRRVLAFTTVEKAPSIRIFCPQGEQGDLHYDVHLNDPVCEPQKPLSLIQNRMLEALMERF
ncbi:hypothetical protein [Anthocerotibacter panamensis]|uniref:hypothetical protein n=1 Tax=Anthocerotibacter panamensis TaxID=2857077 RepID=UPI001C402E20|nr:hypothetical protein [Anthocerotibacter panamensis]